MTFHHELRCDAGVVGAGHPQSWDAFHAMVAGHQIFHADEHGVAKMQFASDVGRRDGDDERLDVWIETFLVRVIPWLEVAARFPQRVHVWLGGFEVISFE